MLFLPKSHERYLAALRNHLQMKLLRQGKRDEILQGLKKITVVELLYREEIPVPIDVCGLADVLLGAAVAELLPRGRSFTSALGHTRTCLIRRRTFSALLLELAVCCAASDAGHMHIVCGKRSIQITVGGCAPDRTVRLLCGRLHAACLYDGQNHRTAVLVPAEPTGLPAGLEPDEWYYLLDPFSLVKIFLSSLPSKGG